MGRYIQHLGRTALAATFALPVGCLLGGFLISLYELATSRGHADAVSDSYLLGLLAAVAAAVAGCFPALLYGVPTYALASCRGKANIVTALAIGIAPGLIIAPLAWEAGKFFLVFGPCVALVTHVLALRLGRTSANNSFKPNPLRGSA